MFYLYEVSPHFFTFIHEVYFTLHPSVKFDPLVTLVQNLACRLFLGWKITYNWRGLKIKVTRVILYPRNKLHVVFGLKWQHDYILRMRENPDPNMPPRSQQATRLCFGSRFGQFTCRHLNRVASPFYSKQTKEANPWLMRIQHKVYETIF